MDAAGGIGAPIQFVSDTEIQKLDTVYNELFVTPFAQLVSCGSEPKKLPRPHGPYHRRAVKVTTYLPVLDHESVSDSVNVMTRIYQVQATYIRNEMTRIQNKMKGRHPASSALMQKSLLLMHNGGCQHILTTMVGHGFTFYT